MFTSYTCGFFDVWFLHLNSGQLLSGKLTVSELSYTFAMPSRSFQRQRRPLTFSWTQCSSLTPSLTVGGSCKHSSLSVKTLPKPFMYRYFLLSSWFRLNWMILCRLFFFKLTTWRYEFKSRASAYTTFFHRKSWSYSCLRFCRSAVTRAHGIKWVLCLVWYGRN